MQRAVLALALLALAALPARADMFQDAGNAKLPEARQNLGLGVTDSPTFQGFKILHTDTDGTSVTDTTLIERTASYLAGIPTVNSALKVRSILNPGLGDSHEDGITVVLQNDRTAADGGNGVGQDFYVGKNSTGNTWGMHIGVSDRNKDTVPGGIAILLEAALRSNGYAAYEQRTMIHLSSTNLTTAQGGDDSPTRVNKMLFYSQDAGSRLELGTQYAFGAYGSLLSTISATVDDAIDLSDATCVNTCFKSPGGFQINGAGEIGLGVTPSTKLSIGGNYTTTGNAMARFGGNLISSNTVQLMGLDVTPQYSPSGASISKLTGVMSTPRPSGALTLPIVAAFEGNIAPTSFTGAITQAILYNAISPTGTPLPAVTQFMAQAMATNNGATTGTILNTQIRAEGITATSAGATINNRGLNLTVPSGGASAGTTLNEGILIQGNGGTAAGGTVTNYAIRSTSTAQSAFAGPMTLSGLPTSAGAGGLVVCVDTAGVLYKKAACP